LATVKNSFFMTKKVKLEGVETLNNCINTLFYLKRTELPQNAHE
jgi:hypothetical protein